MPQKVNLLDFLKKPQKDFFSARKIFIHISCFCLLLLIIIVFQATNNFRLEKFVFELQQQFNVLQQQVSRETKPLVASLESRLTDYKKNNKLGLGDLSIFLKQISEINLCGLWLTQFDIREGGRHVGLQGQFYQEELIFKYQQKLQQWPLLLNDVLTLNLAGPPNKEQPFQFSMMWDKRETI